MEVDKLYKTLKNIQERKGFYFNPDKELVFELLSGLEKNRERYGYMVCPCRLASGEKGLDRDVICPCEYRAPDVDEFGTCYCRLYVSDDVVKGRAIPKPIPERRPEDIINKALFGE